MTRIFEKRLAKILLNKRLLTRAQWREVLRFRKRTKEKLADALAGLGYVTEEALLGILSSEMRVPAIRLSRYRIGSDVIASIPRKMAEYYCLVPVARMAEALTVAMSDPSDAGALKEVEHVTMLEPRPILATSQDIRAAIRVYYENVKENPHAV
jgi:hypothetical protein